MKLWILVILCLGCVESPIYPENLVEDNPALEELDNIPCVECYRDSNCLEPDRQFCEDNECVTAAAWSRLLIYPLNGEGSYELSLKGVENKMYSRSESSYLLLTFVSEDAVFVNMNLADLGIPKEYQGCYEGGSGFERITNHRGYVRTLIRRNDGEYIYIEFLFYTD